MQLRHQLQQAIRIMEGANIIMNVKIPSSNESLDKVRTSRRL